jgi:hypothetical protein
MKNKSNQHDLSPSWLNRLMSLWQPGIVLTSPLLSKANIPPKAAHYLRTSGVLAAIGDGAYCKQGDSPHWWGVCAALQLQLGLPLHISGRRALALHGFTHYLEVGRHQVWLFADHKLALPRWFVNYSWDFDWYYTQAKLFTLPPEDPSLLSMQFQGFPLRVASRERAILEMIHLIGKHHRFEEVEEVFELLVTLDPQKVQHLLNSCTSIKVCRVFLYLAHMYKPAWQKEIDESKINLGKGKREVVKGGRLDSRYLITVPRTDETPDV